MPYRLAIPQYSTDDIIADFRWDVNSFGKKSWGYAENIFWSWGWLKFLQLLLRTLTLCLRHALAVPVLDVHSLPRGKERTKKTRQRLPPLETAFVPLFKVSLGEKHIFFKCSSRRFATTSGRRRKQDLLKQF